MSHIYARFGLNKKLGARPVAWKHFPRCWSFVRGLNSPVPGEFPTQRSVTRSFDVFFDLRPNKRLSKQWWGWWFETPSRPLWRHRHVIGTHWTHQPRDCLLNRYLFRCRSRKYQSSASLAFLWGIHRWHAQRASDAENVSIWWRHHVVTDGSCARTGKPVSGECIIHPFIVLGRFNYHLHKSLRSITQTLSQSWPEYIISEVRQNGRYFADDIFEPILFHQICSILI